MRKLAYALVAALLTATALAHRGQERARRKDSASSHREAPLISDDPVADNTDVYAFVSPDRPDTVTFVANYVPLEEPAGGPNFHKFGDDVLYAINVDNTGDGKEDISYQFRFKTKVGNPNTFLYNTGPIDTLTRSGLEHPPDLHGDPRVAKNASKGWYRGSSAKVLGRNLPTPPVNIGPRSTPNYGALAAGGGQQPARRGQVVRRPARRRVLRRPRLGLRPGRPAAVQRAARRSRSPTAKGVDGVGGYNTHSIVLQVPISQLKGPKGQTTIGVYANSMRPEDARLPRRRDQELRPVGAGLPPGGAADQRGDHPASARRTSGTRPIRPTTASSCASTASPS